MLREEAEGLAAEICEECEGRCFEEDRYYCDGYRKEVDEILEQEAEVEKGNENKWVQENRKR